MKRWAEFMQMLTGINHGVPQRRKMAWQFNSSLVFVHRNNKEEQSYEQWNCDRGESEQGINYMDLLNEERQAMMEDQIKDRYHEAESK